MNENKANYAKIGFFVLAGAALILVAIGVAGAKMYNRRVVLAETYFAESVTGLNVGSDVKYRGVPVGEVKDIGFVFTTYAMKAKQTIGKSQARQILVVMALNPEKFSLLNKQDPQQVLKRLVDHGLRAKLSSSGVTGLSFLELDYFAAAENGEASSPDELPWTPNHIYIPSSSSMMAVLKKAMDDVVVKVSSLDIKSLGDELLATLYLFQNKLDKIDVDEVTGEATALLKEVRETNRSLQALIGSPQLASLPTNLAETVASVRRSAETVEREIGPFSKQLEQVSGKAAGLFDDVGGLVASNRVQIGQTVTLLGSTAQSLNRTAQTQQGAVNDVLENIKSASENLNRVLKEFSENPAVLLYGQPPKPLPENSQGKK
jgi:ABC-type transporter Mla subunit MlaD